MTALLPDRTRPSAGEPGATCATGVRWCSWPRSAGAAAAASTLLVCLALGVVGWFLTDAGAHGTPRDGLRVGALAWLMAHGSGVHVDGVAGHRVMPLGITAGLRLGGVADRPPARRLGLGPRPRRRRGSPTASGTGRSRWRPLLFAAGYVVVAVVTCALASTADHGARHRRGSCSGRSLLCGVLGGAGDRDRLRPRRDLDRRSCRRRCGPLGGRVPPGRSGCWLVVAAGRVPGRARRSTSAPAAQRDVAAAHRRRGRHRATLVVSSLLVVPNAVLFSGSYLLGPGFAVGTGTARLARPSVVARPAADVPAAGRPARHRADAGLDVWPASACRRWSRRCGAARAQRRHPTLPLGGGRPARLRRRHARRRRCSACSPRWPAARSARAGWPTSGRSSARCWCTPSPPSASAAWSAGWSPTWWQRRRLEPLPEPDETTRPRALDSRSVPIPSSEAAPARLVVLVSGSGTNLQALLDAAADPAYGAAAWSPSAPTATASRAWRGPSGPASRRSCTGSADFTDRAALGRARSTDAVAGVPSPTWSSRPAS